MKPQDPKKAAEEVLRVFWGDQGYPVDPVRIAKAMGVDVREGPLPPELSGALRKLPGADPEILLEAGDHANRKRFSCAHELGHYIRRAGDDAYDYVDLRGPTASEGTDPEEVFANKFAANLLMPQEAVEKAAKKGEPLWMLSKRFGVSPEAMKWRLTNLGIPVDD